MMCDGTIVPVTKVKLYAIKINKNKIYKKYHVINFNMIFIVIFIMS